ncbi:TetR/AcrR family transcriptional regulator [Micromonospora sp. NPDC051296]|uniref:TetR/AcrR family transcriptional regulator n=1 Tax=Micromonospora sp. NPDC051296 TaxID=3155046 RepID=UPI00344741E7
MPGPTEVQQARRDNGPLTDRGAARKRELLDAARRVFERKGFIETRVRDVVKEAQVSHGTFYTYFDTKEAIFSAVAHDVVDSMLASMATPIPTTGFDERIRDLVRRFVHAYRPHAQMIGLIEQVGTFSPEMRELRLDIRDTFVRRTRRGITRMASSGMLADPDIDVEYTAEVLGAMLEYSCYLWFCLDKNFDEDRLVEALATVWRKTLRSGQR